MDLRKTYGTNSELESEGVWTQDLGEGLHLKLARLKNPKFRKMYQRLTKPYERQIRNRTLSEKIEEDIITKCLVETVVLDWKGLVLDGKELTYSKENASKLFSDPDLSDFRDLVVDLANDAELFREEHLEDAEKNLLPGSDGTLSGEATSNSSDE